MTAKSRPTLSDRLLRLERSMKRKTRSPTDVGAMQMEGQAVILARQRLLLQMIQPFHAAERYCGEEDEGCDGDGDQGPDEVTDEATFEERVKERDEDKDVESEEPEERRGKEREREAEREGNGEGKERGNLSHDEANPVGESSSAAAQQQHINTGEPVPIPGRAGRWAFKTARGKGTDERLARHLCARWVPSLDTPSAEQFHALREESKCIAEAMAAVELVWLPDRTTTPPASPPEREVATRSHPEAAQTGGRGEQAQATEEHKSLGRKVNDCMANIHRVKSTPEAHQALDALRSVLAGVAQTSDLASIDAAQEAKNRRSSPEVEVRLDRMEAMMRTMLRLHEHQKNSKRKQLKVLNRFTKHRSLASSLSAHSLSSGSMGSTTSSVTRDEISPTPTATAWDYAVTAEAQVIASAEDGDGASAEIDATTKPRSPSTHTPGDFAPGHFQPFPRGWNKPRDGNGSRRSSNNGGGNSGLQSGLDNKPEPAAKLRKYSPPESGIRVVPSKAPTRNACTSSSKQDSQAEQVETARPQLSKTTSTTAPDMAGSSKGEGVDATDGSRESSQASSPRSGVPPVTGW